MVCANCHNEKTIEEMCKSGKSLCKQCDSEMAKERYHAYFAANPNKYRERDRQYAKWRRDKYKTYEVWRRKTLEGRARRAVHRAIERGEITRPDRCEKCGQRGIIEAHHPDHKEFLKIVWLCRSCHGKTKIGKPYTPRQNVLEKIQQKEESYSVTIQTQH